MENSKMNKRRYRNTGLVVIGMGVLMACRTLIPGEGGLDQQPIAPTFPAAPDIFEVTPIARDQGTGRVNPYPPRTVIQAYTMEVEVIDSLRGEPAWQMLQRANMFNQPPLEGWEYVLIRVYAKSTDSSISREFSKGDFKLTGSANIRYFQAGTVDPEPSFGGEVGLDGDMTGWISYQIKEDDRNLIVIVDPINTSNFDGEFLVYISLEKDSSIGPALEFTPGGGTEAGSALTDPIPLGSSLRTDNWKIQILEVIRGKKAWDEIHETNRYNDPPPTGFEYVLVLIQAEYYGSGDEYGWINSFMFQMVNGEGVEYDNESIVLPGRRLDANLYAGGNITGWVSVLAPSKDAEVTLLFDPPEEYAEGSNRFLSIK